MSGGTFGFEVLAWFEVSLVNGAGDFVHERLLPPPTAPTHFLLSLTVRVSEREESESEHGGDNFGVWNETKLRLGPDDTVRHSYPWLTTVEMFLCPPS